MKRWLILPVLFVTGVAAADAPGQKAAPKPPKQESQKGTKQEPAVYSGLGAESLSPAEVAKYAAGPLDERVSKRIQALLDVRSASSGVVTSKGDRQFYSTRLTGVSQVWRQDGPMKFPVQLTGGEDRTSIVGISPDDSFVVVSRDSGGAENPGVYLLAAEGGPLKRVQHLPKVRTSLQFVGDDGKSLYLASNDKDPASYAIHRWDIKSEQRETLFEEKGLWSIADHRGDGTWLMVKALGNTHQEVYEYDVKSKKLTPLLGQGEDEAYDVMYGARPGQVLVLTNKLGNFDRLYSLEAGALRPITGEVAHDITRFVIDRARARIYYNVNEDGYTKLVVLDARTYKRLALPKLPDAENVEVSRVSSNGRFVQLAVDGSTMVGQSMTWDWQTKQLTTWRVPSTPELDPGQFAKASLEYYPARDGTKIPMFVRRPKVCDAPCPVVVDFHGGPESQAKAGFLPYAQIFVDAGFTLVQPNVRGSTGYGKAWLHADNGPKRLQVISDIEDVSKFIRTAWAKDGKAPKLGVTGGSYGGYAVLMAMTYFAGAFDAGVEEVGISNLMTFLLNTAPYRRILRTSEYGDPVKDKEALIELSPITHVHKLKAPLLVIQGLNDPRVPVGESVQIYKQLEQRGIPGGLIVFPDEGHGPSKRDNVVTAMGHTVAFFEKHLLGK